MITAEPIGFFFTVKLLIGPEMVLGFLIFALPYSFDIEPLFARTAARIYEIY